MTMMVRCLIADGKLQRLSYIPGVVRGHGPPDVVKRITDMSAPSGTKFEIGGKDVTVSL